VWVGMENLAERSGPKRPTLIENYKGSLTCMECGIFHTLWSTIRLSYYDLITPQQEGFPLSATWGRAGQLCGIEPF
jgi:hypothetical protein